MPPKTAEGQGGKSKTTTENFLLALVMNPEEKHVYDWDAVARATEFSVGGAK